MKTRLNEIIKEQKISLAIAKLIVHRNLLLNKDRLKIVIKTCSPKNKAASNWGDTHYAVYFSKALQNEGFLTSINALQDWNDIKDQDADIVLHLRGLRPYTPKPGALNILWIISHPEDVTTMECQRYGIILVALRIYAKDLSERVSVPVHVFLQATDEAIFSPTEADPSLKSELLFIGNSIKRTRKRIAWASQMDVDLNVYGMGWNTYFQGDM